MSSGSGAPSQAEDSVEMFRAGSDEEMERPLLTPPNPHRLSPSTDSGEVLLLEIYLIIKNNKSFEYFLKS